MAMPWAMFIALVPGTKPTMLSGRISEKVHLLPCDSSRRTSCWALGSSLRHSRGPIRRRLRH